MTHALRYAMCNDAFEKWPFAGACRALRQAGYTGVEIAPFTLHEDPARITAARRRELRGIMESEGLSFAGLHWLMATPKGLHATGPDKALRERSWSHVRNLIDLCADLGPNGVLVFGSPAARATTGGLTPQEATRNFVDGLASVAPHAAERGAAVLIEPLPPDQCDVVQTLAEAAAIVRQIGSPGLQTMFDVHNATNETEPPADLIDRYFDVIRHVHVNELDGRHCGAGDYDFGPLLEALQRHAYAHWVSVEAFDFSPGPERIAVESLRHLQSVSGAGCHPAADCQSAPSAGGRPPR